MSMSEMMQMAGMTMVGGVPMQVIPARVQVALSFINMMNGKSLRPVPSYEGEPVAIDEHKLRNQEQATYDAALRMLSQYFYGETDFNGPSMITIEPPKQDPPASPGTAPQPVPAT